jgi:hypothetical protein
MHKIITTTLIVLATLAPVGTVSAQRTHPAPKPVVSTKPSYCGTGSYNTSYAAIYAYPTGSYWQNQIAAYPDYYAANNAYYQKTYGC